MHAELPRFAGSEQHALDDKGRLIVPARFRERLGREFVMSIAHPDPALAFYPTETWVSMSATLQGAQNKGPEYREFLRDFFALTEEVGCDSQGRVVIPARLREYAGIDRQVVSLGFLTRIEIWAAERYKVKAPTAPEGRDYLSELGLY